MSTPMAFVLTGVFLVACYVLLIFLERHKKYSLESLMLALRMRKPGRCRGNKRARQ